MPHHTPLIGTIVAGIVVAFIFGALAHRLRLSPIAGYLFAGILIGPFTPGYVADTGLAIELAEIGVILLMFGVGLHFSLKDLLSVKSIAVPGAVGQIAVATALGTGLAVYLGWGLLAGIFFGLALSVASTVVLLKALQARDLVQTERGRIAVGWLIVEDLVMILALVLLPAVARFAAGTETGGADIALVAATTVAKVGLFVALMLIVGKRIIPALLHWAAHTGSRELFRLAVLAVALGVAFGAAFVFEVSFALGAFFAGMILGETNLSKRATEETLPLRDAFAVLFFVSVGMLFDPSVLVENFGPLVVTVLIIVVGKSLAAYALVRAFGHSSNTALTVAASLAQIGEFSFILASLGQTLDILPAAARDLILAGAIISIMLNPLIFQLVRKRVVEPADNRPDANATATKKPRAEAREVILVGYGRVGERVAGANDWAGTPLTIVEEDPDRADRAGKQGFTVVAGRGIDQHVLVRAGIERAGKLILAIPEGFEAGAIVERARMLNPAIKIIARAHSDEEVDYLTRHGADYVVMAEEVTAERIARLSREIRFDTD